MKHDIDIVEKGHVVFNYRSGIVPRVGEVVTYTYKLGMIGYMVEQINHFFTYDMNGTYVGSIAVHVRRLQE